MPAERLPSLLTGRLGISPCLGSPRDKIYLLHRRPLIGVCRVPVLCCAPVQVDRVSCGGVPQVFLPY